MIAFIFPGQGSQKVGMGRALADAFPEARATFDEADAALAESETLTRLIFEGPEDQLVLTQNAQPAILTVSIAAYRVLASRGIEPAFVAGLAIVGHGRSSSKAVRDAIAMAYRFATGGFIHRVEQEIAAASVSPH